MKFIKYFFSLYFYRTLLYIFLTASILFLSLVLFLNIKTQHNEYVEVPDLTGKVISDFKLKLNNLDLKYVVSDSGNYNPDFKINSVLSQLPKPNSRVKSGRKIYLTLNSSDFEMVKIPKITRITVRQARKTIESLGFIFGKVEYVDDIARDEVIAISHEGKEIIEGDFLKKTSVIDFKLGNGKQ